MSRQYKRAYELSIVSTSGESKSIKDLKVTFEIVKSVLSFPNLAKIDIYNPNGETLRLLENKFSKISFSAGYEGNLRLIFTGEVRNVFQIKESVDRIITIFAGDGQRDWQNSIFNRTFSESVSIRTAIEEVMKSFKNLAIGSLEGVPDVADKLRGQTLSGSAKDILDRYAEEYGFTWSIQDGEIVTTPIEEPLSSLEAVLISAKTGMLGSPTITEIGVEVNCLLNPRLMPNTPFQIESLGTQSQLGNLFFRNAPRTNANGLYKVQEVTFSGDIYGGEWTSKVKGRIINV